MTPIFPESLAQGEIRICSYLRQLANLFLKGKEDPRKTVYILVSHGLHVDIFAHLYHDVDFMGEYCCTHMSQFIKCEDEKKPELNIMVLGHYAYK